jgi:AbrB family looped-hinge helix DNA binding protein
VFILEVFTMDEIIEMGTVSSRGQICIPNNIRETMGLEEGSKVLFLLNKDALIMKRVNTQTWAEITKPLREAMQKTEMKESNVPDLIHKLRKAKK